MATGKHIACIYSSSVTSYDNYNNNAIKTESNYVSNCSGETLYNNNNISNNNTHSAFVDKALPVNSALYNYQESESEVESALPVTLYSPRERHISHKIRGSGVKYISTNNTTEFCKGLGKQEHCCSSLPSDLPDDEMSLPYSWSSKYEHETASATRARWLRDSTFGSVVLSEIAECEEQSHSHGCNFDNCINNINSKESTLSYSPTNTDNSTFITPMKKKHCNTSKNTNIIGNDNTNNGKDYRKVNVNVKTHKRVNNTVETRRWAQNVWDYITHPVHEHSVRTNTAKVIESSTDRTTTTKIKSMEYINKKSEEWWEEEQEWGKTCTPWPTSRKANNRTTEQNNKVKVETNNNDNENETVSCNANTKNNVLHYKSLSLSSLELYNYENINSSITASRQSMVSKHSQYLHKPQEQEYANEKNKIYTDKYRQWYQICKNVNRQSNSAKHNLDNQCNNSRHNTNSLPVSPLEVLSPSAEAAHESMGLCTRSSLLSTSSSSSNQFFLDDTSTVVGCIPRRCNRLIKRHVSYGLLDTSNTITMEKVNDATSKCIEEFNNNDKWYEEKCRNKGNSNRSASSDVVNQQHANTTSCYHANIAENCRVANSIDCNDKVANVVVEHSTSTKNNTELENAKNLSKLHNCKGIKECTLLAYKSANTITEPCANYSNNNKTTTSSCNNESSHQLCQHHNDIMPIEEDNSTNKDFINDRKTNNSKSSKNEKETFTIAMKGRGRKLRALFVHDDDDICDECDNFDTFYHT